MHLPHLLSRDLNSRDHGPDSRREGLWISAELEEIDTENVDGVVDWETETVEMAAGVEDAVVGRWSVGGVVALEVGVDW